jgi:hypothetical protein
VAINNNNVQTTRLAPVANADSTLKFEATILRSRNEAA